MMVFEREMRSDNAKHASRRSQSWYLIVCFAMVGFIMLLATFFTTRSDLRDLIIVAAHHVSEDYAVLQPRFIPMPKMILTCFPMTSRGSANWAYLNLMNSVVRTVRAQHQITSMCRD